MANVAVKWESLGNKHSLEEGVIGLRRALKSLDTVMSDRGVYVIRLVRPFLITYSTKASPVLYIGEGNTLLRLSSHFKGWLKDFGEVFPTSYVHIRYAEPRIRGNLKAHRDVEADLPDHFISEYGSLPLFNKQREFHARDHKYPKDFFSVLRPGSGRGYKWGLLPWASNDDYFRIYEEVD